MGKRERERERERKNKGGKWSDNQSTDKERIPWDHRYRYSREKDGGEGGREMKRERGFSKWPQHSM